jgi:hypothetical protein
MVAGVGPMVRNVALLALPAFALSGCIAKTALDVVTLPVRAVSKGVDLATTSQSEADQKRGREIRKREERLGKLQRDYDRQAKKCARGDRDACAKRDATYAEMQRLMPGVPVEQGR